MTTPLPGKKSAVLIVDDDDTVLRSLRIALSHVYDVNTANSALQGLVEARRKAPEVIILDIKMPEHDGFWLYLEIRKFDTKTPIVFNSAYQDLRSQADSQAYSPFAYLPKNGSLREMLTVLAAAVKSTQAAK